MTKKTTTSRQNVTKEILSEIESGLQDAREKERLGIKEGDAIYFVDEKGDDVEKARHKAERAKLTWKLGELTVDRLLKPKSAIELIKREVKRKSVEDVLRKRLVKKIKKNGGLKNVPPFVVNPKLDVWIEEAEQSEVTKEIQTVLTKPATAIAAITLPIDAESYLPNPQAHMEHLLGLEKRISKSTDFDPITLRLELNATDMVERANQELIEGSQKKEEPVEQESEALLPLKRKKRTQQQRRLVRERKLMRSVQTHKKGLVSTLEQIDSLEAGDLVIGDLLKGTKKVKVPRRAKINGELCVKLPEEIPKAMRLLKAEGDPVRERFRNFAARAMIEATGAASVIDPSRRRKRKGGRAGQWKEFVKASHRTYN